MNAERRKQIASLMMKAENLQADIELIRDEEQEAYDAMPESLQDGDGGQAMIEAIDMLDDAITDCKNVQTALESASV
jgi:hypothetical protein